MELRFFYNKLLEFNKDTAHEGDMYLYMNNKLLFIGNTTTEPPKLSLFGRIKKWLKKL